MYAPTFATSTTVAASRPNDAGPITARQAVLVRRLDAREHQHRRTGPPDHAQHTHDQHALFRCGPLMEADTARFDAPSDRKDHAITTSGIILCHLLRPTKAAWVPTCFSTHKNTRTSSFDALWVCVHIFGSSQLNADARTQTCTRARYN